MNINLTEEHSINGFWVLYLNDKEYGEFFGVLTYSPTRGSRIKLVCKRDENFKYFFKDIKNKYCNIIGKTDKGICYSFECLQSGYEGNSNIFEIYLHPNVIFFIDKLYRTISEEYTPKKIETKKDKSFTKCMFKINGIKNYIANCVNDINKNCNNEEKILFEGENESEKIFSFNENELFSLDIFIQENISYNVFFQQENKKFDFVFIVKFKQKISIECILQEIFKIKSIFSFLSNSLNMFEHITIYRSIGKDEQMHEEECSLLVQHYGNITNNSPVISSIFFNTKEKFNFAFQTLNEMCNNNFQKMLALLNYEWNREEFFTSIANMLNCIDANFKVLCNYSKIKNDKEKENKRLRDAVRNSNISIDHKKIINEKIALSGFITLGEKLELIIKSVYEYGFLEINDEITHIVKELKNIRNDKSHGKVFKSKDFDDKKFENLVNYMNIIYACAYIQIMKKINVDDDKIKDFILHTFPQVANKKYFHRNL